MPELAGGDEGEYVLRIRGESMKNAGILEGDYVVVRRQDTATDGEIVVALVGEEATVKRFFREDDHVRLQPENDALRADPLARGARARPGGRRVEDRGMTATLAAPPAHMRAARADARHAARRGLERRDRRGRHRVPGLRRPDAAALDRRRRRRRRPLRRLRHDARVGRYSLPGVSAEEDRKELAELEAGLDAGDGGPRRGARSRSSSPPASASPRCTSRPSRCHASSGWAPRWAATTSSPSRSSRWTSTSSATPPSSTRATRRSPTTTRSTSRTAIA